VAPSRSARRAARAALAAATKTLGPDSSALARLSTRAKTPERGAPRGQMPWLPRTGMIEP